VTEEEIRALPYRPCVGVMLLNRAGAIFAGQRHDTPEDAWQMPQGGIDPGETPREAALRELREEVGIGAGSVTVLGETEGWLTYDLPPLLVPKLWQGRFRGQKQRWFLMRFLGRDAEIDIATAHPEFRAWRWLPPETLLERIVAFKRPTYAAVIAQFRDRIGAPGAK
jgi:putative (di)nucleoside polyphosphate hydrolase